MKLHRIIDLIGAAGGLVPTSMLMEESDEPLAVAYSLDFKGRWVTAIYCGPGAHLPSAPPPRLEVGGKDISSFIDWEKGIGFE